MNAYQTPPARTDLTVIQVLARLLERLEHSKVPVDAGQYLSVAQRLENELRSLPSDEALGALLDAHPAAAEVYENLNYRHAGLCRSSLDASLVAEQRARAAIERAMHGANPNLNPKRT